MAWETPSPDGRGLVGLSQCRALGANHAISPVKLRKPQRALRSDEEGARASGARATRGGARDRRNGWRRIVLI